MVPAFHWHLIRHKATRLTSAPFRVQTPCSGMRPVIRQRPHLGGFGHLFSLSCRLSAAAIRFLAVLSRHGSPPSSRSAYRRLVNPPDHDGVSMFRTGESRPVSGASYTPGPWCSHGRHRNFGHHCHLSTAGPVLRCGIPSPEFWVTRLTEVHTIRPSGLSLACNRWMEHQPLGFLPGSTPRRYQRRMPGVGTGVEHSSGATKEIVG
jgi:hypothetical protein